MESQFHSWQAFIAMGGYGVYVWGTYGALLLSFILGVWFPWRQRKSLLKNVSQGDPIVGTAPENS